MSKTAKMITVLLCFMLALYVPTVLVVLFLNMSSGKVVAQWQQPAEITYDGRGPYNVTIIEKDVTGTCLCPRTGTTRSTWGVNRRHPTVIG
ncbi:MAG: hypothetical protein FWE88_02260 [Phycisphaerae bacterium]|nr:hypothetical protein [Phycisphaerae bacterium]